VKPLKWTTHEDLAINTRPIVRREEYLDYMTFRSNARPLFTEIFGPIIGLKEEWEAQGASPSELDFSAFTYRCEDRGSVSVNTGRLGGYDEVVLEENDAHRITRDALGRRMMLCKGMATLPLPLDHPVKTMDDWLKIKPWYEFSEARFHPAWAVMARRHLQAGRVLCVSIPGGFDEPRQLMGEEALCMAYYDQPELIHDILKTMGDTAIAVLTRVVAEVQVDMLDVHEDLAGKSGSLAGPVQIREFIAPYYKRVWEVLAQGGARLFDVDSDGDINSIIPAFLEAGVNCLHPMEPASNMDIVKVRGQFGTKLAFYGGLDKHVLRQSKAAIVKELEYKIPPMVQSGGCVLALDHRIPNGTPLDNYRFYVGKVWEILDREASRTR